MGDLGDTLALVRGEGDGVRHKRGEIRTDGQVLPQRIDGIGGIKDHSSVAIERGSILRRCRVADRNRPVVKHLVGGRCHAEFYLTAAILKSAAYHVLSVDGSFECAVTDHIKIDGIAAGGFQISGDCDIAADGIDGIGFLCGVEILLVYLPLLHHATRNDLCGKRDGFPAVYRNAAGGHSRIGQADRFSVNIVQGVTHAAAGRIADHRCGCVCRICRKYRLNRGGFA